MKELILRKRNILLLLIPLGIILNEWAKHSAFIAEEIFAKRIYKVISQAIGLLTGWLPFSLAELIVAVGPIIILGLLIRQMIRVIRVKKTISENSKESVGQLRFQLIMTAVQNILCLVSVIFFVYILLCGINYHRYSVQYYLGFSIEDSSVEELDKLRQSITRGKVADPSVTLGFTDTYNPDTTDPLGCGYFTYSYDHVHCRHPQSDNPLIGGFNMAWADGHCSTESFKDATAANTGNNHKAFFLKYCGYPYTQAVAPIQ